MIFKQTYHYKFLSEVGDFISMKCVTHLNKYSINPAHG